MQQPAMKNLKNVFEVKSTEKKEKNTKFGNDNEWMVCVSRMIECIGEWKSDRWEDRLFFILYHAIKGACQ